MNEKLLNEKLFKLMVVALVIFAATGVEFLLMPLFHTPHLTTVQELSIWFPAYFAGRIVTKIWNA
jgi:hypothetical protein